MTVCCGHWTTEAMCTCAPASLRRCLLGLPGSTFLVCLQRHPTSPGSSGSLPHIDSGSLMPANYIQCPGNRMSERECLFPPVLRSIFGDPILLVFLIGYLLSNSLENSLFKIVFLIKNHLKP